MATQDEQERLLDEALTEVKLQSFQMKRSLDKSKLMDGLKHATTMLGELRAHQLSPKSYYELYMAITDELRHLEIYLLEEFQKGRQVSDLYELVQYAGNIVPRLYLLITVGVVYIKCNELSRKDILRDLVEMSRGVQHPLRGLFLRNYLLQCLRVDLLPDTDIEQGTPDSEQGTTQDSIDFILLNFSEMNKLWVRMQHQGHTREKEKREQERKELRLLVGTNLNRLSQLESINVERYKTTVLPAILEQIVNCHDAIAQEYLMDVVIQVFPDEFHLETLETLLRTTSQLEPVVHIKSIIGALIERLSQYATEESGTAIPESIPLFDIFSREVNSMLEHRKDLPSEDIMSLEASLLHLALKVYPEKLELVSNVVKGAIDALKNMNITNYSSCLSRELIRLLKMPIDVYKDIRIILKLEHYSDLIQNLDYNGRKLISCHLLNNTIDENHILNTEEQLENLFKCIQVLIIDSPEVNQEEEIDPEEFEEEQNLLAKSIHLFRFTDDNLDQNYRILVKAKNMLAPGGSKRLLRSYVPIVFQTLNLAIRYHYNFEDSKIWQKKLDKVFKLFYDCVSHFANNGSAELALRIFLQGALTVDKMDKFEKRELLAYEFFSQAFSLFEEEIGDSRAQISAITLITSTLERVSCLSEDNHFALRSQCAKAGVLRLIKKMDQSRAVALTGHLFWSGKPLDLNGKELRDFKKVISCLDKSEKLANECVDVSMKGQLLIELLSRSIYFFQKDPQNMPASRINALITKIRKLLPDFQTENEAESTNMHFTNIINFIVSKQQQQSNENDESTIFQQICV